MKNLHIKTQRNEPALPVEAILFMLAVISVLTAIFGN